jgi:hypothetical protein
MGLSIEFDGCGEANFDPSFISNGYWDEMLAHILLPISVNLMPK